MSATIAAARTVKQYRMFIDGEWVDGGGAFPVLNPATEEVIAEVAAATPELVDAAVLAAERAQGEWARLPAIKRARYLHDIAKAISARKAHLAHTISEEQGKVLPYAETEVEFSAEYFDYMAEFARHQ